jgi:hypothetical protein
MTEEYYHKNKPEGPENPDEDFLLTPLEECFDKDESGVLNLGIDPDLDIDNQGGILSSDKDFLLTQLDGDLDETERPIDLLGSDLPHDDKGEVDLVTLFGDEGKMIDPDLSIDPSLNRNSNYEKPSYIGGKPYWGRNPSEKKLEVSKLEVRVNFPELPKELTNRIEVVDGEIRVIYEGRFYDIEKTFIQRDIEHLSITGKVSLKRTDVRKERREKKADITLFTPQYTEVEVPEDKWCIDLGERKTLYRGFSQRYSHRLSAEALNQGIWVYDNLLDAVFSPIEDELKEWMRKVVDKIKSVDYPFKIRSGGFNF